METFLRHSVDHAIALSTLVDENRQNTILFAAWEYKTVTLLTYLIINLSLNGDKRARIFIDGIHITLSRNASLATRLR